MTELCRAALWYSDDITITGTKMHGIKALRECSNVKVEDCDIISPEFGWSVRNIEMRRCHAESEYFMMRSENIHFEDVNFKENILSSIKKCRVCKLRLRYERCFLAR